MLHISSIRYILIFVLLVFLQVVILNSISFLSFAIPLVYIYFIIKLPVKINQNLILLLGFALGFVIDLFSNTPGVNAAATTVAALVRKPIMSIFFMTEEYADTEPAIATVGTATFIKFSTLMILLHTIVLVSIESFSYFNIKLILFRIVFSTFISAIIIFGFEGFGASKKNNASSSWRKI